MADTEVTESPLAVAAGAAGPHATEAFALLADETRLSILLALWEAHDPHGDDNAVAFSEIFERVDYDDPGNLRYHLTKLDGQFVRQQAAGEGYELRVPGLRLIRAVIAGAGVQDATLETTEIDRSCPFCGGPTVVRYREGVVVQACTECEGAAPERTDTDGLLSAVSFDPAGLVDRTPAELAAASRVAAWRDVQSLFDGLCPACSGSVDGWLDCCTEHDPTDGCENCGTKVAAWARFQCRICKNHSVSSPKALALFHPAVISFYDDHGVSTRVRADDFQRVSRLCDLLDDHELVLVSEEPPRVDVTVAFDDDELRLTFDETADVVDVRR